MLLTISTNHQPATDLGFLLHKNPNTVHVVDLAFDKATTHSPSRNDCTPAR